jgi:hypothetical protein
MGFAQTAHCVYGQRQAALTVMWGSAAWAQSQSTPGASALAAPHQSSVTLSAGLRVRQPKAGSQCGSRQ